jgi:hypothetical protein
MYRRGQKEKSLRVRKETKRKKKSNELNGHLLGLFLCLDRIFVLRDYRYGNGSNVREMGMK